MCISQTEYRFQEMRHLRLVNEEILHFTVHPGELTVKFIFPGIRQRTAVKDIAAAIA